MLKNAPKRNTVKAMKNKKNPEKRNKKKKKIK